MKQNFAIYEASGRILSSGFSDEPSIQIMAGERPYRLVECRYSTHYFDANGDLQPKTEPAFAATLSAQGSDTEIAVADLPDHTLVSVRGPSALAPVEINDGTFELLVNVAGTYTIIVDAVQYLKQEITVEIP